MVRFKVQVMLSGVWWDHPFGGSFRSPVEGSDFIRQLRALWPFWEYRMVWTKREYLPERVEVLQKGTS